MGEAVMADNAPDSFPVGQAPWEQAANPQPAAPQPAVPDSFPVGKAPWETAQATPQAPAKPDMSAVQNYVKQNLAKYQADNAGKPTDTPEGQVRSATPAKSFFEALKAGFQISTLGLGLRGEMPDKVLPENAPLAWHVADQAAEMAGDLPAMLLGGAIGGTAGGAEGATVGSFVPGVGTAIGGVGLGTVGAYAGANALPAALRKIMMDHYEKGDIKTPGEFLSRAMGATWAAVKGAVTGSAAAVTGGATEAIAPAVAAPVAKLTSELATMTTVGSALQGKLPKAQDFIDGAIVLGGLHAATASAGGPDLPGKLRSIYANTGETPDSVVNDAQRNPVLKQELLSENPDLPMQVKAQPELAQETPAQTPESAPNRTDAENKVLSQVVDHPGAKTDGFNLNDVKRQLVDDLDPIKQARDELAGKDTLPASKDPYVLARNFRAWSGSALRSLQFNTTDFNTGEANGEGLLPILNDTPEKDMNGLTAYLVASRAIEKEGQGIETGVDLDAAKQVVSDGQEKFGPVAERLQAYQNRMVQYAVDSGLISQKSAETFKEANKNYVPFYRLQEEDPLTGKPGAAGKPFKMMTGSDKQILNPLASVFNNTVAIVKAAEKNRVMQALTDLPEADEWMQKSKTPMRPVKFDQKEIETILQNHGVDTENVDTEPFSVFRPANKTLAENEFPVYRDGKREVYRFSPELAEAAHALDYHPGLMGLWARIATPLAKSLRAGIVFDPAFLARHFMRMGEVSAIQSEEWHLPFAGAMSAMKDIWSQNETYQKFLSSGGANNAIFGIKKLMDSNPWALDEKTGMLQHAWNMMKSPLNALHFAAELSDYSMRLDEYKRLGGAEGDINAQMKAGYASRNITLDYTRIGQTIRSINPVSAFLNVGIQGTTRMAEAFKDNPVRTASRAIAFITIPSILTYLYGHKDSRYQDAPDFDKDLYWLASSNNWQPASSDAEALAMPEDLRRMGPDGKWQVNNGITFRVSKPFEYGVLFGSLPERILSAYFDKNPDQFHTFADTVLHGVTPNVLPTVLTPILEQATNRNFFTGGQLVSSRAERLLPQYQYTDYTSETAKQLGKIIGATPLGNFGPKDAKLSSPMVIDNYIRDWTGTLGQYALQLADKGLHAAGIGNTSPKPADTLADIPFIKEFIVRNPAANLQPIQDFYDKYSTIQQEIQTMKQLAQDGDFDSAQKLLEAHPEAQLRLGTIEKALSAQNAFIQKVYDNPKMSPTDKRQLINTAYYQMNQTAKAGNSLMEKFEESQTAMKGR